MQLRLNLMHFQIYQHIQHFIYFYLILQANLIQ